MEGGGSAGCRSACGRPRVWSAWCSGSWSPTGSGWWTGCSRRCRAGRRSRENSMHIVQGGLEDPRVVTLLYAHRVRARAETAPGSAHALDVSGLRTPEVTFWSAWEGDEVVGIGALKRLSANHGEVKSMHTAEAARGK